MWKTPIVKEKKKKKTPQGPSHSRVPTLLWVLLPRTLPGRHRENQRISVNSSRERGEGTILKYIRAYCSYYKACPQEKLFYHCLIWRGFIRTCPTWRKRNTQLQLPLSHQAGVKASGGRGRWGGIEMNWWSSQLRRTESPRDWALTIGLQHVSFPPSPYQYITKVPFTHQTIFTL